MRYLQTRSVTIASMFMFKFLYLLCLALSISIKSDVYAENDSESIAEEMAQKCPKQLTCSECVQLSHLCIWCWEKDYTDHRCNFIDNFNQSKCENATFRVEKENSHQVLKDKDFRDVESGDPKQAVQIKPQNIKMILRPGQPYTTQFKYRVAKNYPLDLYYLMDLTYTMRDDIKTMVTVARKLAKNLDTLTKHYRLAFGYFSDKIEFPFSFMTEKFLKNPCTLHKELGQCNPGYDFKHGLNFTNNIQDFIRIVNASEVTSSLDNLEGCMDAIYQILLCDESKINWNKDSRKLILLATDGLAHFGGDGKLSGSVKKPKKCSLDKDGVYDSSLINDYPSLEEVYRLLWAKKTNIIFAAKSEVFKYYQNIDKTFPEDVSFVTKLEGASKNILQVVSDGYQKFVSIADFRSNHTFPLNVRFRTTCNEQNLVKPRGYMYNQINRCDRVKEGQEIVFNITFVLEKCPENEQERVQTVIIEERNIGSESLTVEVEYLCDCNCTANATDDDLSQCSSHGKKECGVCKCNPGWSGTNCDCDMEEKTSTNMDDQCRNKTSSNPYICSQNGNCFCGKCECNDHFTGELCECPPCPKFDKFECGGALRGKCDCGKCECYSGYKGDKCECSTFVEKCIAEGSRKICNNRGTCECETCICKTERVNDRDLKFSGKYCDICFNCDSLCLDFEPCVAKYIQNNQSATCLDFQINDITKGEGDAHSELEFNCSMRHRTETDVCDVTYGHDLKSNIMIYSIDCNPAPMPASAKIGLLIIVLIVFIGMLLLFIIKCRNYYADKREFAKYQNQLSMTSYQSGENPLYLSPISKYEMPRNKSE